MTSAVLRVGALLLTCAAIYGVAAPFLQNHEMRCTIQPARLVVRGPVQT